MGKGTRLQYIWFPAKIANYIITGSQLKKKVLCHYLGAASAYDIR